MTYGRRHYLTQQILVRLAYAGPTTSETREFLKASARFLIGMVLIFFGLAAVANGQERGPRAVHRAVDLSPGVAESGEFMYRSGAESGFALAPAVGTRVRFDVTGTACFILDDLMRAGPAPLLVPVGPNPEG